jgi:uncharacterized membrane-anchored protein
MRPAGGAADNGARIRRSVAVSIGVSAFLIIAGAILRFAVTWSPDNVNLQVIGVILMISGAVGLVAAVVVMIMRRRNARSAEVYEERRYIQPPP